MRQARLAEERVERGLRSVRSGLWLADRSGSRRFSLDMGMRSVSNALQESWLRSRATRSTLIWEIPVQMIVSTLAGTPPQHAPPGD